MKYRILFVCLGNICRSPMAEGSFQSLVESKGLQSQFSCDSAGTSSYHIGEQPDKRMVETALKHGVSLNHAARQLSVSDFEEFDYIIAMDSKNFENIQLLAAKSKKAKAQILLMRDYDTLGTDRDVPDPYYGAMNGFEEVYEIVTRCNENFLNSLLKEE